MSTSRDSTALMGKDLVSLASSVTHMIEDQREMKKTLDALLTDKAVREERDIRLNQELANIRADVKRLYTLGIWVLTAFGSVIVAAIAQFIVRGGLNVGG